MKPYKISKNFVFRLSKFKVFDAEFIWEKNTSDWFCFDLRTRTHQDHPGFYFTIHLLRYFYFNMSIYDIRHWDYERDEYEIYN